ncbi:hypothetical protein BpHYR1_006861 [Brachionus plicatilis]|uniref:Uncharacterized protein n=1 Tax=Brachionus plicatilis TaxID=10195 RepID=A0A3M7PAC5_BRAPC|nr:hypothetical protein BpHYR1_006861 [Brachionus plicatilis]
MKTKQLIVSLQIFETGIMFSKNLNNQNVVDWFERFELLRTRWSQRDRGYEVVKEQQFKMKFCHFCGRSNHFSPPSQPIQSFQIDKTGYSKPHSYYKNSLRNSQQKQKKTLNTANGSTLKTIGKKSLSLTIGSKRLKALSLLPETYIMTYNRIIYVSCDKKLHMRFANDVTNYYACGNRV